MEHARHTAFFTLGTFQGRHCLIDPEGKPFFTIGLNHTDETNLLYPYNIDIWEQRYGSHEAWLKQGVAADMVRWGFNTVGWTQENIASHTLPVRGCTHSLGWTYEDYIACGMPYCVNLEVADIPHWNNTPTFPDVFTPDFEDWCDYLARNVCARHRNSSQLIGYFFTDIPAWEHHRTGKMFPQLEGLDPASAEYVDTLAAIAERYYSVMVDKIRQYDPHHLILGDRFNGNVPDNDVVYMAAARYCDVISIQYFTDGSEEGHRQMEEFFDSIYEKTGKPLLLADIGNKCPTQLNPANPFAGPPLKDQADRARDYIESMDCLMEKEYFLGWHWCAYIENPHRGWGIKSHLDEPYEEFLDPVSAYNEKALARFRT